MVQPRQHATIGSILTVEDTRALIMPPLTFPCVLADAPLALFVLDATGTILLIGGGEQERLGLAVPSTIGRNAIQIFSPHPLVVSALRRALDGADARTTIEVPPGTYDVLLRPCVGPHGESIVIGVAVDVTERIHLERDLRHQATHDSLTGLPNRMLFEDRLALALHAATRAQGFLSVLLLDLDDFKSVNDTYGHACGDALLQGVAARLVHAVRASDTLARLGGDEYACVLPETDGAGARHLVTQIQSALDAPVKANRRTLQVGLSCGIATFPGHGINALSLLLHADRDLYRAKRAADVEQEDGPRGQRV